MTETVDVFHDDVSGSKVVNHSAELGPEPSFVFLCESFAGEADGLTWKASTENIDPWSSSVNVGDIFVAGDVGPMVGEDPSAELVGFALPEDSQAGSLKAAVEPADP